LLVIPPSSLPAAPFVMAGLDPAIHAVSKGVDPRVKPGDDGSESGSIRSNVATRE